MSPKENQMEKVRERTDITIGTAKWLERALAPFYTVTNAVKKNKAG